MSRSCLEELTVKFIVNLDEKELFNSNRLMTHVQTAYWYYLDFMCIKKSDNKRIKFKPFLIQLGTFFGWTHETCLEHLHKFFRYQKQIPRCGGVLFNEDMTHVLLVKSYSGYWGLPVGKINEQESKIDCAIRETNEEVSFDISHQMDKSYKYVNDNGRKYYLFKVCNVPFDHKFHTTTRNEIRIIQWVDILCVKDYLNCKFSNVINELCEEEKSKQFQFNLDFEFDIRKIIRDWKFLLVDNG